MRIRCSASLPPCLLFGTLLGLSTGSFAPLAAAQSDTVYPQIVRLSNIRGDVRVARGKSAEKAERDEPGAHTGWEKATAGLPLEAGYSLVTGDGSAEIELENASTLELAPNSVLALDSLQSQNSVTYTEVSLLSGSLIINSHPESPGDNIRLNTPTDHLTIGYPGGAVWRVDSYLDAIAITRLEGAPPAQGSGNAFSAPTGRTMTYAHGRPVIAPASPNAAALLAWQNGAVSRIDARQAALTATMKQAGLSQPLPGLDQLADKGTFFSCAPYGTCWEPKGGWDGKSQADVAATDPAAEALKKWTVSVKDVANPGAAPPPGGIPSNNGRPSPVDNYLVKHPGATFYTDDYAFPCAVQSIRELVAIDPVTGKESIIASEFDSGLMDAYMRAFPHRTLGPNFGSFYSSFIGYDASWGYLPWDWTVCHSGAWIRFNHRYAWVASERRHYHCPVHWVHNGHHQGYVPIHPRDVMGKPPLNLKYGLFHVDGKHSTVERVNFEADRGVKVLAEPPREFRKAQLAVLKMADTPRAEAHSAWASERAAGAIAHGVQQGPASIAHGTAIVSPAVTAKSLADAHREGLAGSHHEGVAEAHHEAFTEAQHEGVPINFDRRTQSFSVSREVSAGGGRQAIVSTPLGGGHAFGPTGAGGWNNTHAGGNNGGRSDGGVQARNGSGGFGGGGNNGGSASRGSSPSYNGGANTGGGSASHGGGGGNTSGGSSPSRGGGSGGGGFSGGGGGGGGASHSGGGGGGFSGGGGGGGAAHGGGGAASAPSGGGASSGGGAGASSGGGGGHK